MHCWSGSYQEVWQRQDHNSLSRHDIYTALLEYKPEHADLQALLSDGSFVLRLLYCNGCISSAKRRAPEHRYGKSDHQTTDGFAGKTSSSDLFWGHHKGRQTVVQPINRSARQDE